MMMGVKSSIDNLVADKIRPIAKGISEKLQLDGYRIAIVGGFVRDHMLSHLFNKDIIPADIDLLLDDAISGKQLRKIPGVRMIEEGSYCDHKFYLDGFGMCDIWSSYTPDVESVLRSFDFNCNAVGYSYSENKIIMLPDFFGFLESQTLSIINATWEEIPRRGLKLQAKLSEQLGTRILLDNEAIRVIKNISERERAELLEYMNHKANSDRIFQTALAEYNKIINQ